MRGQLSAEMIVLLVVILALVALVASYLTSSGQTIGEAVEKKANATAEYLERTCFDDADCPPGQECVRGMCQ